MRQSKKLEASRLRLDTAPRQITSLGRLSKVPDASKSIFGVRKNPSWAGTFGILRSSARRSFSGRRDRLFGVPKPREIDASADVTVTTSELFHWTVRRPSRTGKQHMI